MRLMVIGDGLHAREVAARLDDDGGFQVEHCRSARTAEQRLRHGRSRFGWVVVTEDVDTSSRERIYAASQARHAGCLVSVVAAAVPRGERTGPGSRAGTSAGDGCAATDGGTAAPADPGPMAGRGAGALVEDAADAAPEEVERWRNVLAFAARSPDAYPALRDALVSRPVTLEFHAPCKRSA